MKTGYNPKLKKSELEKKIARQITTDEVIESGITGQILSLSSIDYIIEKKIVKRNPNFKFTCCEFDPDTYYAMLKTVAEKKLPFFDNRMCALSEIIYSSVKNNYAHIIADYCRTFNSHAEELEHILRNDILKIGGTLAITLSKSRFQFVKSEHYKRMCKIKKQVKGTNKTEHALNVMTAQYPNYEVIVRHNYKAMILFIIRRVK